MSNAIKGATGIGQLVADNFAKWGIQPTRELIDTYVSMAKIESDLGRLNNGPNGNKWVNGTWQIDTRLVTGSNPDNNLVLKASQGRFGSLPKEVQQKMAAEFNQIQKENGGDIIETLRDQRANLIGATLLQAENAQVYSNMGLKDNVVKEYLAKHPDHTFELSYIKHQLPPKQGSSVTKAIIEGKLDDPIEKYITPVQVNGKTISLTKSNPATYKGVQTVGDFLKKLDSYQLHSEAAAANNGVTLPSSQSVSAVVADITAQGDKAFADKLNSIEKSYRERNGAIPENEKKTIAETLTALQKLTSDVYSKAGIEDNALSRMLALHVGPYTAAAIAKADDNAPLKDASVTIDGKKIIANKKSVESFLAEMRAGGIPIPANATFDTLTAGQFEQFTQQFYYNQTQQAASQAQQADAGTLPAPQKQNLGFMSDILKMMPPEMGMIMSLVVSLIGLMGFGQQGQAGQAVESPAQTQAPSATLLPPAQPATVATNPVTVIAPTPPLPTPKPVNQKPVTVALRQ
jgi:hypothetical protein